MIKKKISKEQKFSLKDIPNKKIIRNKEEIVEWKSEDFFLNSNKTGQALLDCLCENDTESFMEILDSYLRVNRLQLAKKTNISRSTIQQAFTKGGNPTLKTIAKIVHESYSKK